MTKARERVIRARALREGDEIKVNGAWWVVEGQFKRKPARIPWCDIHGKPMTLTGTLDGKPDIATFECDGCRADKRAQEPVHILLEDVPEHMVYVAMKRGSKQQVMLTGREAIVTIIRRNA